MESCNTKYRFTLKNIYIYIYNIWGGGGAFWLLRDVLYTRGKLNLPIGVAQFLLFDILPSTNYKIRVNKMYMHV